MTRYDFLYGIAEMLASKYSSELYIEKGMYEISEFRYDEIRYYKIGHPQYSLACMRVFSFEGDLW